MKIRIYYEDTDAGGVVYYANYLKFAERARTELLREKGVIQSKLDIAFVVKKVELELFAPARLDDELEIKTIIDEITGARIIMQQEIYKDEKKIAIIKVVIAAVNLSNFKPQRISTQIFKAI